MTIISFAPDVCSLLAKRGAYSGTRCPMKKIQLGGHRYKNSPIREYALVDDEDFERVNKYKWSFDGRYARREFQVDGKRQFITLHRFIMDTPKDMVTDHRDGNKLNNQKSNLRICTLAQNAQNQRLSRVNTSGYKGVSVCNDRHHNFVAHIGIGRRMFHIGAYDSLEEAALAYNEAAKKYFGEFANLNKI